MYKWTLEDQNEYESLVWSWHRFRVEDKNALIIIQEVIIELVVS